MAVLMIILFCIVFTLAIYLADKFAKWCDRKRYEEQRELYRSFMADRLMDNAEAIETFRQMCEEAEKNGWK